MRTPCLFIWLLLPAPALANHHGGSQNWLDGCVAIHAALFKGDTKAGASSLKSINLYKGTPVKVRQMLKKIPTKLKEQRAVFKDISKACRADWEKKAKLQRNYVVMTCPMVQADWIQPAGKVQNPFAAESMPHCGYQILPKKK